MTANAKLGFIVITGTREYSAELRSALRALYDRLYSNGFRGLVIHGGCPAGADAEADDLWEGHCWSITAPWDLFEEHGFGRRIAGPVRNGALAGIARALLEAGVRGAGYAFPKSKC